MNERHTCLIGGEAGFGIMSAGVLFGKMAIRSGYGVADYAEYPSIIRGGHNAYVVTIGEDVVSSVTARIDTLVALHPEAVTRHLDHLHTNSLVLFEEAKPFTDKIPAGARAVPVPFQRLAKEVGGSLQLRNSVALGALVAVWGGELALLQTLLDEEFQGKSDDIRAKNRACAEAGYLSVHDRADVPSTSWLTPKFRVAHRVLLTGNDACALGAIAADVEFTAIYPMTPTSNILHTLAPLATAYDMVVMQPEDEISAMLMAVGAGVAGRRSMVATSGGGFCLMTEGLGLAGITETPVVIIEGMRGGPATGLPTWTEQGDLRFVLHAHHGEFPRIVLAPGDQAEAFALVGEAFFLADQYQLPVIVLTDKHLAEGHMAIAPPRTEKHWAERGKLLLKKKKGYQRYALTKDGISERSILGVGNTVVINSDEHDEAGYSTEEAGMRVAMMEKRMGKLEQIAKKHLFGPTLHGPRHADLTIVSFGSTKGAILEALRELPGVNFIQLVSLLPFPSDALRAQLRKASALLVIEENYSGQLAGLIAEKTGIDISHRLLRFDGRPFFPEDIIAHVRTHFFV